MRGTLLVVAAACGAAALTAGASLGVAPPYAETAPRLEPTKLGFAADPTLWRLTAAATLLVSPQMALASFAVVFFDEERGLSLGEAAAVLAGSASWDSSASSPPARGPTRAATSSCRSGC